MKQFLSLVALLLALYACSGSGSQAEKNSTPATESTATSTTPTTAADPNDKGIGKFQDIKIDPTLNPDMAAKGQGIFDVKCGSCHKLTDEKLVGPGWKGVTARHRPEWIMNFATNVEEMLSKDPKAQAMLELCLVRMPNQNLTDDDARNVLEFMRKNDGIK